MRAEASRRGDRVIAEVREQASVAGAGRIARRVRAPSDSAEAAQCSTVAEMEAMRQRPPAVGLGVAPTPPPASSGSTGTPSWGTWRKWAVAPARAPPPAAGGSDE